MAYNRMTGLGTIPANPQLHRLISLTAGRSNDLPSSPPAPPGYTPRTPEELARIRAAAAERQRQVDETKAFFRGIVPNELFAAIITCSVLRIKEKKWPILLPIAGALAARHWTKEKDTKLQVAAAVTGAAVGFAGPCAAKIAIVSQIRT